jgi:hypothetical protein
MIMRALMDYLVESVGRKWKMMKYLPKHFSAYFTNRRHFQGSIAPRGDLTIFVKRW